jgi:hypothetical protein
MTVGSRENRNPAVSRFPRRTWQNVDSIVVDSLILVFLERVDLAEVSSSAEVASAWLSCWCLWECIRRVAMRPCRSCMCDPSGGPRGIFHGACRWGCSGHVYCYSRCSELGGGGNETSIVCVAIARVARVIILPIPISLFFLIVSFLLYIISWKMPCSFYEFQLFIYVFTFIWMLFGILYACCFRYYNLLVILANKF